MEGEEKRLRSHVDGIVETIEPPDPDPELDGAPLGHYYVGMQIPTGDKALALGPFATLRRAVESIPSAKLLAVEKYGPLPAMLIEFGPVKLDEPTDKTVFSHLIH